MPDQCASFVCAMVAGLVVGLLKRFYPALADVALTFLVVFCVFVTVCVVSQGVGVSTTAI